MAFRRQPSRIRETISCKSLKSYWSHGVKTGAAMQDAGPMTGRSSICFQGVRTLQILWPRNTSKLDGGIR
jgi:hypothetical protein